MNKEDFEQAVSYACADVRMMARTKWKKLEKLFSEEGYRGGGALSNALAERRSRIRQLATRRPHPGFQSADYSRYCVFVLNHEHASKDRSDTSYFDAYVLRDLLQERPGLPPAECMESVLVIRRESSGVLTPRALVRWGNSDVTTRYTTWYPGLRVVLGTLTVSSTGDEQQPTGDITAQVEGPLSPDPNGLEGRNVIFFGPPGTGKSHLISQQTEDWAVFRTVFHPEYSHADFIGSYKPVSGRNPAVQIIAHDGITEISRPIVYYDFEPGVLIQALIRAHASRSEQVALVIEEINRGDCAAIFGHFFQLLDRSERGSSQYGIRVPLPLGKYLLEAGILSAADEDVYLPANLSILATMNTSDQSLYPMDAAFKRRWDWVSVSVDSDVAALTGAVIESVGNPASIPWLPFLARLNQRIVDLTANEDKRVGPWYIKPRNGVIQARDVRNKLLFYLWHDVFRGRPGHVFATTIRTFDQLQTEFDAGGLMAICPSLVATEGSRVVDAHDQTALP